MRALRCLDDDGKHTARDDERGTVIVIVAVMLTLFIILSALAIDLSSGRTNEQRAQSAADAAALAAADAIPTNNTATNPVPTAVTAAATSYAASNMPGSDVSVTMTSPTSVDVTVSGNSPNAFAGLFTSNNLRVSASASASLGTSQVVTTGQVTTTGTTVTTGVSSTTSVTSTTSTTAATTTPGNVGIYAADTSCDAGLTVSNTILGTGLLSGILSMPSSNVNLSGTTLSNGDLGLSSTNLASNNGTYIYGGPNGCSFSGANLANNNTVTRSTTT